MPRASILIPTHDHWATLPLSVDSALEQTVHDIEVMIVGDGVTDEVRSVATNLSRSDDRVAFLDFPKGPHHGEIHRDSAIARARSDAIFYLCDDDLLLPRHVENLLSLLTEADLVQSRNGYVEAEGSLVLFPTDLSDPEAVAWHLRTPRRNATSLTGTAHRRSTYLGLPEGWTTTPADEWPDHHMWKKFFRMAGFRGATHPEMTAVQLPTSSGRELADQAKRAAELAKWRARLTEPDAHEWIQSLADSAAAGQLAVCYRQLQDCRFQLHDGALTLAAQQERAESAEERATSAEAQLTGSQEELRIVRSTLSGVLDSRSWRLTAPLRALVPRMRKASVRRGLGSGGRTPGELPEELAPDKR